MDELFEATFSPLAATGRPLSKCGKCKRYVLLDRLRNSNNNLVLYRYMKYISLKPNRLHCATCDETYSLPLNGHIKLYKELCCVSNTKKNRRKIQVSLTIYHTIISL